MFNRDKYINTPIEIEADILAFLKPELVKTVFDIGACEAEDSIKYSILFPNATVYAFEPRLDNIEIGKKSILKYQRSNIILENVALSNINGTAIFYLSEGRPSNMNADLDWDFGNKSSSLLPPSDKMKSYVNWLEFKNKVEVNTIRIETYVTEKNITEIDFMHIDVQGAELMVLEGASNFIEKIKLIWMEVEAVELYKNQPLKNDVESFMKKNNFVNVIDTVNGYAGDQLYVNLKYFTQNEIKNRK